MIRYFLATIAIAVSTFLVGCDTPESTIKSLRKDVQEYTTKPSEELSSQIDQKFQKLDEQIAQLEKSGRTSEAEVLQSQAADLGSQYQAAKVAGAVRNTQKAIQGIGEAFKDTGESIGNIFKEATSSSSPTPTPEPSPDSAQ